MASQAIATIPTPGNIDDALNNLTVNLGNASPADFDRYGPSEEELVRIRERQERARAYRPSILGRSGTLKNGVRWWLDKPQNPGYERTQTKVQLYFSDPRAVGLMSDALHIEKVIEAQGIENIYTESLEGHALRLSIRQLQPAEPGDPEGFFVKWGGKS